MTIKECVSRPFGFIKGVGLKLLLNFIQHSHSRVIALVLAHMKADKASIILQNLPFEILGDVAGHISTMNHVSPEITWEIEQVLNNIMSAVNNENEDYIEVFDVEKSIVENLKHVNCDLKEQIIMAIKGDDHELDEAIDGLMMTTKSYRKN